MSSALDISAELGGSYNYQPLIDDAEIRILTLQPGQWDAPIECQLRHSSLDKEPDYEALSYVWGDPTETRSISLNQHDFRITWNLEVALRYLRLENEPRTLWVDALCINQNSIPERNQQVRGIWRIYQSARKVVAWLGEESDDTDEAFAVLKDIQKLTIPSLVKDEWTTENFGHIYMSLSPQILRDVGFDAENKNWIAFFRFWQRPYWTRMWIIQEQYFSGSIFQPDTERCIFACGRTLISRSDITHAWSFILAVLHSARAFMPTVESGMDMRLRKEPLRSLQQNYKSGATDLIYALVVSQVIVDGSPTQELLSRLLFASRGFKATDPRDKIFAILGMLGEKRAQILVDYTKPIELILKEAVEFAITEEKSLMILYGNRAALTSDEPSWLPVAERYLQQPPPWMLDAVQKATKGIPAQPPRFDDTGKILFVYGVVIGTVRTAIGPFKLAHDLEPDNRAEYDEKVGAKFQVYWDGLGGEPERKETFWRTLVMDQAITHNSMPVTPAPSEYGRMCETFFTDGVPPEDYMPDASDEVRNAYAQPFNIGMGTCMVFHNFFDTDTGYMGLGPFDMQPGDVAVVLIGGAMCFVLRPKGDHYQLLGEAYVQGAMNGQFIIPDDEGNVSNLRDFGLC